MRLGRSAMPSWCAALTARRRSCCCASAGPRRTWQLVCTPARPRMHPAPLRSPMPAPARSLLRTRCAGHPARVPLRRLRLLHRRPPVPGEALQRISPLARPYAHAQTRRYGRVRGCSTSPRPPLPSERCCCNPSHAARPGAPDGGGAGYDAAAVSQPARGGQHAGVNSQPGTCSPFFLHLR